MKTLPLILTAALLLGGSTQAAPAHDGQHDFDYLIGSWTIHLKKRVHLLSNADEWIEFDGKVTCRTVWDGNAEVEEFVVDAPDKNIHIQGLATRLYNQATGQWSIYWANRKNGVMDPTPVVGGFDPAGNGEFYGFDTYEGRQVLVRFAWTNTRTARPHFEQSYSPDGGKTWEVNWITEQTKVRG